MPVARTCSGIVRDGPIFGTSVGFWHSMIAMGVVVAMSMTMIVVMVVALWFPGATDSCRFFELLCTARMKSSRVATGSLQARMR